MSQPDQPTSNYVQPRSGGPAPPPPQHEDPDQSPDSQGRFTETRASPTPKETDDDEARDLLTHLGFSHQMRPLYQMVQMLRQVKEKYEEGLLNEEVANSLEEHELYPRILTFVEKLGTHPSVGLRMSTYEQPSASMAGPLPTPQIDTPTRRPYNDPDQSLRTNAVYANNA